jgi:hypothetical protein
MRTRKVEKLLYKVAALLVVAGAIIRIFHLSNTGLGLYLILAGHVAGITAIFMYMKYVNDKEYERQRLQEERKQPRYN